MPKLIHRVPKYRHHRQSGRGIVTLDGRDFLLPGPHKSDESIAEYDRLIGEWISNRRTLPASRMPVEVAEGLTVRELAARYITERVRTRYIKGGAPTSEQTLVALALRPLLTLYGDLPAKDFKPSSLKAVRHRLLEHRRERSGNPLTRKSVNDHIVRIRAMFAWGVAEELVPHAVHAAIKLVDMLEPGRTTAPDNPRVRPVPQEHIDAVRPLVSRHVRAIIDVQLASGMRPGEVCAMRGCDLTMPADSDALWEYRPASHKTEHHGKERIIFLGPRAKAVVAEFLRGDPSAYLFSPRDAVAEQLAAKTAARTTPLSCGNRPGSNTRKRPMRAPGAAYTTVSYNRAIRRACEQAGVSPWHPHQLRHNAATLLRREIGSEHARVVLGHNSLAMVDIYAEIDREKAKDAMKRFG